MANTSLRRRANAKKGKQRNKQGSTNTNTNVDVDGDGDGNVSDRVQVVTNDTKSPMDDNTQATSASTSAAVKAKAKAKASKSSRKKSHKSSSGNSNSNYTNTRRRSVGDDSGGGGEEGDIFRIARCILLVVIAIVVAASITIARQGKSPFSFDATKIKQKKKKIQKEATGARAGAGLKDDPGRRKERANGNANNISRRRFTKEDFDIVDDEESVDWDRNDLTLQRTNDFLTNYVCSDDTHAAATLSNSENAASAYCHPLLKPEPARRTHSVAKTASNDTIKNGDIIMVLPRHLLIWDLDAMRDPFVADQLLEARHGETGNPLDSGAFLASYLVRLKLKAGGLWSNEDDHYDTGTVNIGDQDQYQEKRMAFLNMLPSYQTLQKTHPTLWSDNELATLFGRLTPTFALVRGYKNMMNSEFDAFCAASDAFNDNVDREDYVTMRIHVMSRSFGPGLSDAESWLEEEMSGVHHTLELQDELDFYQSKAGVDLTRGTRAMSPILDMWDHHAVPNVQWRYRKGDRAFVITAANTATSEEGIGIGGIPSGQDIMVSYGTYTDTHLFAKFGFVNGDGSEHTEASVAIMHPMLEIGTGFQFSYLIATEQVVENKIIRKMVASPRDHESQKRTMLNYLRYDDGYEECVTKESNPEGYQLKLLKLLHLEKIANRSDRWTVKIKPRDLDSNPSASSDIPILMDQAPKFDPSKVKFDGSRVISTCRLVALTTADYDGKAIDVLTKGLLENSNGDHDFMVDRQSSALEYRALTCLARLTTGALELYPSKVRVDMKDLADGKFTFQSKEWTAAHVRLGEMQTLEVLRSIAKSGASQMKSKVRDEGGEYEVGMNIHRAPCPLENNMKLLEEEITMFGGTSM